MAVVYLLSGQDWEALDRVVNDILEDYITSGMIIRTVFFRKLLFEHYIGPVNLIRHESEISDMLDGLDFKGPLCYFKHRLTFVAQYAELHRHLAHMDYAAAAKSIVSILSEGLAPRSWYAIILTDSIPLLRSGASFGIQDYIS